MAAMIAPTSGSVTTRQEIAMVEPSGIDSPILVPTTRDSMRAPDFLRSEAVAAIFPALIGARYFSDKFGSSEEVRSITKN